MRKFLKILAGIGAVVGIAIAAVMFTTSGMTDTADKFFTAVKSGNYEEASSFLSEDFKSSTSRYQLETYLTSNALNEFKEASWSSRSIQGGRGELVGSITTEAGGVVPVSLGLIKGEDDWKIYSIKKPASGIQEETKTAVVPSEKEQIMLASETMHIFAVSIKEKNMSKMFDHVSNLWQKQITVEKFDELFGAFYKLGDTLMVVDEMALQFTEKTNVNEDGVMVLKGLYPTAPNQVHFEQRYIYEGLGWKLVSFYIEVK